MLQVMGIWRGKYPENGTKRRTVVRVLENASITEKSRVKSENDDEVLGRVHKQPYPLIVYHFTLDFSGSAHIFEISSSFTTLRCVLLNDSPQPKIAQKSTQILYK